MRAVFFSCGSALVCAARHDARHPESECGFVLASGVGHALRLLSQLDFRLFAVPHHRDVAVAMRRGLGLAQMQYRLADLLFREQVQLDGFETGPHTVPDGGACTGAHCACGRAQATLLLRTARRHGIDRAASWLVVEHSADIEAGNRAACRTLLVDNGSDTVWRFGPQRLPRAIVPDLYAAAQWIVAEEAGS